MYASGFASDTLTSFSGGLDRSRHQKVGKDSFIQKEISTFITKAKIWCGLYILSVYP